jgi:hypothetical protein
MRRPARNVGVLALPVLLSFAGCWGDPPGGESSGGRASGSGSRSTGGSGSLGGEWQDDGSQGGQPPEGGGCSDERKNGDEIGCGGSPKGSGGASTTGGTLTSSGGAASSTGGTGVSLGGANTSSACTAASFTVTNGYADNGTFCGYARTAKHNYALTVEIVEPPCGTGEACFEGPGLCADITLEANDPLVSVYTGARIVWNIAQASGAATADTFVDGFTSVTPTFTAAGFTGEIRVILQSSSKDYCVPNAKSGTAIPFSGFKKACWESDASAISVGTPIEAISLEVNGTDTPQAGRLCLTGLTVAR